MNQVSTICYEKKKHIIEKQLLLEQELLAEYAAGQFSPENPLVKVNPYGLNPLGALVMFTTDIPVTVTITVKGREAAGDITHTFAAATEHVLPVLGLYADCENSVEVFLSTRQTNTLKIRTEALRDDVLPPRSISTTPEAMEGKLIFVSPTSRSLPHAIDYAGDCRWILTDNFAFDMTRFRNGHLFIGGYRLMHPKYHMSGICEMNMLGKMFAEYRMPGCYHHDHMEMEDGNILTLTQDFKTDTVEDLAVLLDRKTGKELKSWDFKNVLPQDVAKAVHWSERDWFHCNAVDYDKKNHAIILSGRHQDAIISLDYETGALNWILGDPEGWPREMVDKYFFTPVGDVENFDWQYEQHDCRILPTGEITCFDNGTGRSKNPENRLRNRDNFSRGVVYRIDEKAMTIEQVWQFGKELGSAFFSPYICNTEYLGKDHFLVHSGGIGEEGGVASDKMGSALDFDDPDVDVFSRTVEIKNGEIVYDMVMPGQFYRAKKMDLYSPRESHAFGVGALLGNMDVSVDMDVPMDCPESDEPVPASCEMSFFDECDRIEMKAKFEKGTLAVLILEQGETRKHYFINTAREAAKALCVATFVDKDDRWVRLAVSKTGLCGDYAVKLLVNDTIYPTGIVISA